MTFDWLAFFRKYHIEWVERGPNVAKGNVNIHCPFCGQGDPSHHMGISLASSAWGCWRNPEHRGRNPVRLICALIHCSKQDAQKICGVKHRNVVPSIGDTVASLLGGRSRATDAQRTIVLPDNFKPFQAKPSFSIFRDYLERRGYARKQIRRMSDEYGLRYCTSGAFRGRIVFPLYFEGKLVSWTGRTVYQAEPERYKTLTVDEEKAEWQGVPAALGAINHYLLWYDDLLKGFEHTILLVEGPFDALKVRVLGAKLGVTATCFFTQAPTREQVVLLNEALPLFRRKLLVLDRGTLPIATRIAGQLGHLGVKVASLPDGIKDPGELDAPDLLRLLENNF